MSNRKLRKAAAKYQQQTRKVPWWAIGLVAAGAVLVALVLIGGNNNSTPANSTPANYVPEAKGAPALKVDKEKVDLGDVPLGQTVQVSFDIANVGDQVLRFNAAPYVEVVEGC
jgi:hypothetical protein